MFNMSIEYFTTSQSFILSDVENLQSNFSQLTMPNVSKHTHSATPEPPLYIVVTTTVFYALIFLFGLIGNLLVIFVVAKNPDMKTSTNFFLVNLSVTDLLVILVCMPTALVDIYSKEYWYFGHAMCK